MVDVEIDDAKQYTTVATHFDGSDDAPVQCRVQRRMEGFQGFTRSHWMPPSGKYLLRIIPADNGVACKKKMMKKSTILAGHFDGRGGAPVRYRTHRLIEGVQGYNRSHWLTPPGKYCGR
jgi:hypothetical protein